MGEEESASRASAARRFRCFVEPVAGVDEDVDAVFLGVLVFGWGAGVGAGAADDGSSTAIALSARKRSAAAWRPAGIVTAGVAAGAVAAVLMSEEGATRLETRPKLSMLLVDGATAAPTCFAEAGAARDAREGRAILVLSCFGSGMKS